MDNKYKNGKIYTIRFINDNSLIYVGSTVQPLYKRFIGHKTDSKQPKNENILLYKNMNETNINDWYIELFEDFPCDRKEQLSKREGEIIREIGTLNKRLEGRTQKEYKEANKDKIKEKDKKYREENKDKKKEYDKKRDKDKLLEYAKEYFKNNKDKIKENYLNNKDQINEKRRTNRLKKKLQKEEANIITIS